MDYAQNLAMTIKTRSRERGLTVKQTLEMAEIKDRNFVTKIETGTNVGYINIVRIADTLKCSVDYLLGRTLNTESLLSPSSKSETELISLYRQLNQEGREKILDSADDLVASGKYKKSGADFVGAQAV